MCISGLGVCFNGIFNVHYASTESMTFMECLVLSVKRASGCLSVT